MRYGLFIVFLMSLMMAGCSSQGEPEDEPLQPELSDLGVAPELTNEIWLNTQAPLRLADLRGKVVVIDMWTFG